MFMLTEVQSESNLISNFTCNKITVIDEYDFLSFSPNSLILSLDCGFLCICRKFKDATLYRTHVICKNI